LLKKPSTKAKSKKILPMRKSKTHNSKSKEDLLLDVADLRMHLEEATETLSAIRSGAVDAVVVSGPQGEQVYALKGAEQPYRILVESMNEGALTLTDAGVIMNCNKAFGKIVGTECESLIGRSFKELVAKNDEVKFDTFWKQAAGEDAKTEIDLNFGDRSAAVYLSITARLIEGERRIFAVVTDISDRKRIEAELAIHRDHLEKLVNDRTKELHAANENLELRVKERSGELISANTQLSQEVEERKGTEESLRSAYTEIQRLKDRFQAENIYLHKVIDKEFNFGEIIGNSNALEYVFFKVEQVAPQEATVLLLGETGTGKGVIARAIHSKSSRRNRSLITVNCSALPANLIESELFGREKGAFTGSSERQLGRFELADNSTLFLDEIGEMPMDLQTKLLRVVQDGEFERLGSPKTIKVNVRIIASTNRNLEESIKMGNFREDLFYRLNVFPITIPPLRQRKEDIPLLVDYFVAKFNKKTGKKIETVSSGTLTALQNYNWPGNVRELESVIERAVITSQGTGLQILDQLVNSTQAGKQEEHDFKALADLEREHILQVLEKTGWRIEGEKGAAAILGLNPSTLRGRMRKDGIHRS
jgi:formate hydrogenlyase transcriptional activator